MNLHGIAIGAISAVNPESIAFIRQSIGYTTAEDGTQVPQYIELSGPVEVQSLSAKELQHLSELNIQSVTKKLYAYGALNGVVREAAEGGDIIRVDGVTYLVVHVFEDWPDWCAVGLKQQVTDV